MKQKIITTLKKNILIVELPENTQYDILINSPIWKDGIKFLTGTEEKFHFIKGSYTLLGSPTEIKEDDAKELVNLHESGYYKDYINGNNFFTLPSKSLLSAIETVIFWNVNPIDNPDDVTGLGSPFDCLFNNEMKQWHEAQEKTFDRNRSIILFKN